LKILVSILGVLLVVSACNPFAAGDGSPTPSANASAAGSSEEPDESGEPAGDGGLTIVECDPATDEDCQVAGLRVVQPVPVGEQVRMSVRIRNASDEPMGPVTILVRDSAGEADLGAMLPIAGCSRPCEFDKSEDGVELRAEWQLPIEASKAVTLTLVLTAKEAAEHLLDVSLFASPMADIPENPIDDPTKLTEWLGVVVTVEE
jgi:hypothetical protein